MSFVKPTLKPGYTLCIENRNLKDTITPLIPNYNKDTRYKVVGEFDREHRIMYLNLKEATPCEFQPNKK